MRILLLTQLFQPEPNHLKGLAFAKELIRFGHEVEVLTGFPNYPGGKVYEGYKIRWRAREVIEGVPVIRLALYPSHSGSGLRRFACYASFALSASLLGPFLVKRPDVVHVYQGPATLALPAMILRLFFKSPYVLDVQDIWPDSVESSGMMKFSGGIAVLRWWSRITYLFSRKIVVLSSGYKSTLESRGCPGSKLEVIHNWCEERESPNREAISGIAEKFHLSGRFNVVFAGTMGKVQALDSVLYAATILKKECPDVQFVFVGDGVDAERLKKLAFAMELANVIFIPRQPPNEIGKVLSIADVLLIHLKDDRLGRIGIPQKTQAYLAAGRPVVMAVRGDAADLVKRAGAGLICEPENPESIADAVRKMFMMTPEQRKELGENGSSFYRKELSFGIGIRKMESLLRNAASFATGPQGPGA